jgi:hypothetical protein
MPSGWRFIGSVRSGPHKAKLGPWSDTCIPASGRLVRNRVVHSQRDEARVKAALHCSDCSDGNDHEVFHCAKLRNEEDRSTSAAPIPRPLIRNHYGRWRLHCMPIGCHTDRICRGTASSLRLRFVPGHMKVCSWHIRDLWRRLNEGRLRQ